MCFDVDYDWYAEVNESREVVLVDAAKCAECRRKLQPGETAQFIYQRQREECQECDGSGCEDGCSLGQVFEAHVCLACYCCSLAVIAAERAAGCSPEHSSPAFGELWEAFRHDDEGRYRAKAVEMFPELAGHIAAQMGKGGA